MENVWLRRYSFVLAAATFFLIIAGAAVTSNQAGLSVPDWPLSYGKVMPEMKDGVFYEHGHRMVATTVGFLTVVMAIWLRLSERRKWLINLGWAALGLVIAQGVLGGLTVLFLLPKEISIAHACMAQLFFSLTCAIAVFLSKGWATGPAPAVPYGILAPRKIAVIVPVLVLCQLLLGAAFRHNATGIIPHVAGAVVVTVALFYEGVSIMTAFPKNDALNRTAGAMMAIVGLQLILGLGAYAARAMSLSNPGAKPGGWLVFSTVAHVAGGALALAASVVMAVQVFRYVQAAPAVASARSKQQAAA